MKPTSVYLILLLLGIVAIAAAQRRGQGSEKPGSCYRPSRYRREVLNEPVEVEEQDHEIIKRQIQGGNGVRPGYPNPGWGWKPTAPTRRTTTTRRPRCYSDYDCLGNQKCCSGNCQTPAFTG